MALPSQGKAEVTAPHSGAGCVSYVKDEADTPGTSDTSLISFSQSYFLPPQGIGRQGLVTQRPEGSGLTLGGFHRSRSS